MNKFWSNAKMIPLAAHDKVVQLFSTFATAKNITFLLNIKKAKLMATGLYVTTPMAFVEPVKRILDGVLLQMKTIPALIPSSGLHHKDPNIYYKMPSLEYPNW